MWVLLALSACASPAPRGPVPAEPAVDVSAALIVAHNRLRVERGLGPLSTSAALDAAAARHAGDMAARRRMSHRGSGGTSPSDRMAAAGYRFERAGENVAAGQRSVEEVMRGWMLSPGHRRNVLGNFHEIGAARATDGAGTPYWCVTFGKPAAP